MGPPGVAVVKLAIFMLDLTILRYIALQPPSISTITVAIILAFRLKLATLAQNAHGQVAPSRLLDSLLVPTVSPPDAICAVCREDFDRPHKISCDHVFCRDCISRTLASRDSCPLCSKTPSPLRPLGLAKSPHCREMLQDPFRYLCQTLAIASGLYTVSFLISALTGLLDPPTIEDYKWIATIAFCRVPFSNAILDLLYSFPCYNRMTQPEKSSLAHTFGYACVSTFLFTSEEAWIWWVTNGSFVLHVAYTIIFWPCMCSARAYLGEPIVD